MAAMREEDVEALARRHTEEGLPQIADGPRFLTSAQQAALLAEVARLSGERDAFVEAGHGIDHALFEAVCEERDALYGEREELQKTIDAFEDHAAALVGEREQLREAAEPFAKHGMGLPMQWWDHVARLRAALSAGAEQERVTHHAMTFHTDPHGYLLRGKRPAGAEQEGEKPREYEFGWGDSDNWRD